VYFFSYVIWANKGYLFYIHILPVKAVFLITTTATIISSPLIINYMLCIGEKQAACKLAFYANIILVSSDF